MSATVQGLPSGICAQIWDWICSYTQFQHKLHRIFRITHSYAGIMTVKMKMD